MAMPQTSERSWIVDCETWTEINVIQLGYWLVDYNICPFPIATENESVDTNLQEGHLTNSKSNGM